MVYRKRIYSTRRNYRYARAPYLRSVGYGRFTRPTGYMRVQRTSRTSRALNTLRSVFATRLQRTWRARNGNSTVPMEITPSPAARRGSGPAAEQFVAARNARKRLFDDGTKDMTYALTPGAYRFPHRKGFGFRRRPFETPDDTMRYRNYVRAQMTASRYARTRGGYQPSRDSGGKRARFSV